MAKRVPYKCRFGHITIRTYSYGNVILGTIICDECIKFAGMEINTNYHATSHYYNKSVVRYNEKAIRI